MQRDEILLLVRVTELKFRSSVPGRFEFETAGMKISFYQIGLSMMKPRGSVPPILVDPARGHCYSGLIKLCEPRGVKPSAYCSVIRR